MGSQRAGQDRTARSRSLNRWAAECRHTPCTVSLLPHQTLPVPKGRSLHRPFPGGSWACHSLQSLGLMPLRTTNWLMIKSPSISSSATRAPCSAIHESILSKEELSSCCNVRKPGSSLVGMWIPCRRGSWTATLLRALRRQRWVWGPGEGCKPAVGGKSLNLPCVSATKRLCDLLISPLWAAAC